MLDLVDRCVVPPILAGVPSPRNAATKEPHGMGVAGHRVECQDYLDGQAKTL